MKLNNWITIEGLYETERGYWAKIDCWINGWGVSIWELFTFGITGWNSLLLEFTDALGFFGICAIPEFIDKLVIGWTLNFWNWGIIAGWIKEPFGIIWEAWGIGATWEGVTCITWATGTGTTWGTWSIGTIWVTETAGTTGVTWTGTTCWIGGTWGIAATGTVGFGAIGTTWGTGETGTTAITGPTWGAGLTGTTGVVWGTGETGTTAVTGPTLVQLGEQD